MENSKMELKMDEMEQVAAGSAIANNNQESQGPFVRACYNILRGVYNKIIYSGKN